jgi:hypothetical protein
VIAVRNLFTVGARRGGFGYGREIVKLAVWAAVLAWAAWIGAHWAREAVATPSSTPTPRTHPAVDLDATIAQAVAAPIFGKAEPAAGEGGAARVALKVTLRGVMAGGGGPMGAVVSTGGDDEFVQLGRELSPGVTLKGVYPTHISVDHDGVTQRVELEPVRSDTQRSRQGGDAGEGRPPHGRTAHGRGHAEEASSTPSSPVEEVEAAPASPDGSPAAPLAPPMKNSRAAPHGPSGSRSASASSAAA